MPRFFISYRRDDSAFAAQAIYDKLKEQFGEESITFDVNFSLGVDFAKKIDESVCRCDVVLAIIGDRWLDLRFADGPMQGQRRLDDPNDWVRLEIASALKRDILVIPVLVGKVSMPDILPHLPTDLADLAKKVALSVRSGPDLPNDLQLLVRGVKRAIRLSPLTASDMALPPGVKVVPQGLRSFDQNDDGFFIYLLPGPYQRDGLPERLGFWKTRIEASDGDSTFRVGLIYGPSGCGKSSLIKAGLLPRLDKHVSAVYVEATATDTEARLLAELHKDCPYLAGESSLQAALRRKDLIPSDKKVLVVLDQFEQYLHSTPEDEQDELAQALRECDGGKLQCILMVRDDFLTPVNRFMKRLDIPLAEDRNLALVDLFDRRHAKKVLALLGQAYGGLPASGTFRKEQDAFLNQAISDLSEGDHVICVRLALFAAMVKDKEWKPATLKSVGGAKGVGVAFLEDSFVAQTVPGENRRHRAAAQRVLAALLPEPGTSIKGAMRTKQELLKQSGYARRPDQFVGLLDILDKKLRLVTPTEPVIKSSDGQPEQLADAEKRYQLTHDYLVPSLREWLTSKKKETRRGRAALRLAERSELWTAKPENRHLPSLWEFLNIRLLTNGKDWTGQQRKMMRRGGRVHCLHSAIAAFVLVVLVVGGREIFGRVEAKSLVEQLDAADIAEIPRIVAKLAGYRRWADPLLRQEDAQAEASSKQKLHLALALLPVDESKVNYLRDQLLVVTPTQFPVVRDASLSHKDAVIEPLWSVVLDSKRETQQRFQAACALATYDPENQRWAKAQDQIADDLVAVPAVYLASWMDALRPVREKLLVPLTVVFRDAKRNETERSLAADILADYAADQPQVLADLLADAEQFQLPVIFAKLAKHQPEAIPLAENELAKRAGQKASEDEKERLAKRQANSAVALLRMGKTDSVWPVLQFSPDSRVRSYLIHLISPLGGDPQTIIQRLDKEPDVTARRALILALGEFTDKQLPVANRQVMVDKLLVVYENEPDAGLHGAAEWLLRKWGHGKRVQAVLDKLHSKEDQLAARKPSDNRQWYVDTQSQTFVVIDAHEFLMGSPESEPGRFADETQHRCHIGRRFAVSTTDVTRAQFAKFQAAHPEIKKTNSADSVKTDDSPQVAMTWYEAAAYCNWLSEQEGIVKDQWCYEPNDKGEYGPGMKAKEKYLELSGYRLPTEAEWEYACRAGTVTSRNYGLAETLLPQYAWYLANGENRTWPVGSLKPNDFGLFDMHGNVWQWCDDSYHEYPKAADAISEDLGSTEPVVDTESCILRGGAYVYHSVFVRSAIRLSFRRSLRSTNFGFRPARTLPLNSSNPSSK